MARGKKVEDQTILQMALVGYQVEREKIDQRIHELQSLLKGKRTASLVAGGGHMPVKRQLSDRARGRIAAAQRRRWAEHRRLKGLKGRK